MLTSLVSNFAASCSTHFLGLPSWFEYLKLDPQCRVVSFNVPGDIILVVLAIVDLLLHIAGVAAVIFVLYGGVQFMTSQGNPDAATKARNSIVNALIGLALALVAIGVVSFFGSKLGA